MPSNTNGSRTNQFDAPTSFITSTSRRRAKIESRMVFAISATAEIIRIRISPPITASTTAALRSNRSASAPPYLTPFGPFSTPGMPRTDAATFLARSGFASDASHEAGSGLVSTLSQTDFGTRSLSRTQASALETYSTALGLTSLFWRRRAPIAATCVSEARLSR
jgi:hypothetical protein